MKKSDFSVSFTLPEWLDKRLDWHTRQPDETKQMALAIDLSELNVKHGGGPFAAVVFDRNGNLISAGVNQVISTNCSVAHAEIMALMFAQKKLQRFRLNMQNQNRQYSLVSSSQPCAMCFGAILWSGINRLVYGAGSEDVERFTGFDEGPLPLNWQEEMRTRGIETIGGLLRESACSVLKLYRERQGIIY